MADKKGKNRSRLHYFIFPVVLTIFVVVGLYLRPNKPDSAVVENIYPAEQHRVADVVETIENGVYTNYTYGFRFEYPDEIFDDVYEWKDSGGKLFRSKGWFVPALRVKPVSFDEKETFYQDCVNTGIDEVINPSEDEWSPVSVKVAMVNDFCISRAGPNGFSGAGSKYWTYDAIAKPTNSEYYFRLSWEEDAFESLGQHRKEFYSVVESFEIVD